MSMFKSVPYVLRLLAMSSTFLTRSAVRSMCCRHTVASTEFLNTTIRDERSTRRRINVVRRERRITLLVMSF